MPMGANMPLKRRLGLPVARAQFVSCSSDDARCDRSEPRAETTTNDLTPENFQSLTCKPDYMRHNFEVRGTLDPRRRSSWMLRRNCAWLFIAQGVN